MDERVRVVLSTANGRPTITTALTERVAAEVVKAEARFITIEGQQGVFCEGVDMDGLLDPDHDLASAQRGYAAMLSTVENSACPVVALVDGVALGGGLGLAAAADLVIATPRSTFGLPEVLVGVVPAMALPYVAQRIGHAKARLLALDGGTVDATTALRLGLIDEIADDLEAAVTRHARRWIRMDARAQREVKVIAAAMNTPGSQAEAIRIFTELHSTAETKARMRRMVAGQPPWLDDSEDEV